MGILLSLANAAIELCSYAAILLWLKEVELKRTILIKWSEWESLNGRQSSSTFDDHEWSRPISLALALVVLSCLAHAL